MPVSMSSECMNVEGEVVEQFRDAEFARHGRLYGILRWEASKARRELTQKLPVQGED